MSKTPSCIAYLHKDKDGDYAIEFSHLPGLRYGGPTAGGGEGHGR